MAIGQGKQLPGSEPENDLHTNVVRAARKNPTFIEGDDRSLIWIA
jgi:hypothetical protein